MRGKENIQQEWEVQRQPLVFLQNKNALNCMSPFNNQKVCRFFTSGQTLPNSSGVLFWLLLCLDLSKRNKASCNQQRWQYKEGDIKDYIKTNKINICNIRNICNIIIFFFFNNNKNIVLNMLCLCWPQEKYWEYHKPLYCNYKSIEQLNNPNRSNQSNCNN